MATVRPVGHFSSNENHTGLGRCVYGFNLPAAQAAASIIHAGSMSASRRSLLSERLHSKEVVVVYHQQQDDDASMSEEENDCFDDDGTDDGCTFAEDDWSWLDAQESSVMESDRSSHASSQPIAIPARYWGLGSSSGEYSCQVAGKLALSQFAAANVRFYVFDVASTKPAPMHVCMPSADSYLN
jgi:hypothetical protein